MTAVHSGTVTPVVSWPTDSVIVLPPTASAFFDGLADLVERLAAIAASSRLVELSSLAAAVAGGEDDRVVLEDLVLLEQPLERLRGGDAVEQPERVPDLVAQLGGGERVLLVGRQACRGT